MNTIRAIREETNAAIVFIRNEIASTRDPRHAAMLRIQLRSAEAGGLNAGIFVRARRRAALGI